MKTPKEPKPSIVSYSFIGNGNAQSIVEYAQTQGFTVKPHGKRGPSKIKSDIQPETAQNQA